MLGFFSGQSKTIMYYLLWLDLNLSYLLDAKPMSLSLYAFITFLLLNPSHWSPSHSVPPSMDT